MRAPFDSIASRTTGVLVVGLLGTVAATLAVFTTDMFHDSGWGRTSTLMERIALVAAVADRLPSGQRTTLAGASNRNGLSFACCSDHASAALTSDLMTRHLARDIAVAAQPYGLNEVKAGRMEAPTEQIDSVKRPHEAIQVWLRLSDGSWLTAVVASSSVGALSTLRLIVAALILALGIGALAVWAARKTTAPLARFELAAERLGMDVNAAPMLETGPREIRQAARTFNQMQQRLQRFVDDRTLMLGAISHDLRTVLTRLELRVEFIEDPEQKRRAQLDLHEMDSMLGANLAFARDDFSSECAVQVDVAVQLASLCDELADSGFTVAYDGPSRVTCTGRPIALRRVFTNLIENALHYGREALVSLSVGPDAVEVTVADRGPGIPPALREQVFAPFYRADAARGRHLGGTGLGLTVARSIVRGHGGDIELGDRPDGGLAVRVSLPR